ncbi:MAG: formylglycine-generating enzyme family protein [Gammaproteobacteria bacterium]
MGARPPGELDDPIFLNILRGGRLGLLDFELTKAAARLLPRGRIWVKARPFFAAALLAAGGGFAFHEGWARSGAPALRAYWEQMAREENARWTVKLTLARDASDFAGDFETMLTEEGYTVQVAKDQSKHQSSGDTLLYPPGGAEAAGRLAQALRHWTYGAPLEAKEKGRRGTGDIDVRIEATWAPGAVFHDTLTGKPMLRDRFKDGEGLGPEMVVLPGGTFRMGCLEGDPACDQDEHAAHAVTIEPFAIGRYEVTFEDYDRFAKDTKRKLPDDASWGRGRQPVINVTWDDAQSYAAWLSEKTGRHYRLPTEAEWEYAARGGTTTSYWWGNEVGRNHANCDGCGSEWDGKETAPAGSFAPNPFGLYDTAGNVWEWVQDCYHGNYQGAPADGSAWPETGGGDCNSRVVRGGSWYVDPRDLRSADRYGGRSGDAYYGGLGFRLARAS